MNIDDRLNKISTDLAELKGRVNEALPRTATKTDIAELKLLIEQKLQTQLSPKQKAALITAVTTAATSLLTAAYALFSQ